MDKKKLNAKDFINIGIFTVIYFVMFFITGMMELGLIERIIAEEEPAAAENLAELAKEMDSAMEAFFIKYASVPKEEIASGRYDRFRRM